MPTPILDARDILSGEQGSIYATLPNGRYMCVMHAKNIEATVSYEKEQVPILGKRGKGNRKTGETYSGSMTIYYITTLFRKMAQKYAKEGILPAFKLIVTNEDKSTTIGKQTVVLYDCTLDSVNLVKFDVDSDALDEDIDFTFSDFDILDEFGNPVYTG